MALLLDSLYDALKRPARLKNRPGRPPGTSRATTTVSIEVERDLSILKWMVGAVIAMQLGTFWMQWQVVDRLAGIEARLTAIESGSQASNVTPQVSSIDR